jgi:hypothetical protein
MNFLSLKNLQAFHLLNRFFPYPGSVGIERRVHAGATDAPAAGI